MNENERDRETNETEATHKDKPKGFKNHIDALCKDIIQQSGTANFWLEMFALIGLAVYASITGCQLSIMRGQLSEMKGSGTQTKQLIDQATAQANAAKAQSDQAIQQTGKMGESLTETKKLIRATSSLARASQQQASAQESQLALTKQAFEMEHGNALNLHINLWQFGKDIPKSFAVGVFRASEDRTFKFLVIRTATLEFRDSIPPYIYLAGRYPLEPEQCDLGESRDKCLKITFVGNTPRSIYDRYKRGGNTRLYIWGWATYRDESSQRFRFCQYVSKDDVTEARQPDGYKDGFHPCNEPK